MSLALDRKEVPPLSLAPRERNVRRLSDEDVHAVESAGADQHIGSGTFGNIYSISDSLCVKVSKFPNDTMYREALFLAMMSGHPHVVDLKEMVSTNIGRSSLVLERCKCNLREWIHSAVKPERESRVQVIKSLIQSVELMHRVGIWHCDIKPENIMLTDMGEIRIIDFGLSGYQKSIYSVAATPAYSKPKLRGRSLDIYASGMVCQELLGSRFTRSRSSTNTCLAKCIHDMISGNVKNLVDVLQAMDWEPLTLCADVEDKYLNIEDKDFIAYDIKNVPYPAFFSDFLQHNLRWKRSILATLSLLVWRSRKKNKFSLSSKSKSESQYAINARSDIKYFVFFRIFVMYIKEYCQGLTALPPHIKSDGRIVRQASENDMAVRSPRKNAEERSYTSRGNT